MTFENFINLNILTEPEVLSAIITAIIGAIAGFMTSFLSWIAGSGRRKARNELRSEHLIHLYEPLDELLSFERNRSNDELLVEINKLVSANYRYATPVLIETIQNLQKQESLSESDFSQLQIISVTLFNWYKKKLGYSYIKTAINRNTRKYLPNTFVSYLDPFGILSIALLLLSLALLIFAICYIIKLVYALVTSLLMLSVILLLLGFSFHE